MELVMGTQDSSQAIAANDFPPFSMSCRVCSHFKRGDIEAAALVVQPPLDGDEARAAYESVDERFYLPRGSVRRHMLQCVPVIGLKERPPEKKDQGPGALHLPEVVPAEEATKEPGGREDDPVLSAMDLSKKLQRYIETMEQVAKAMCQPQDENSPRVLLDPKTLAAVISEARKGVETLAKINLDLLKAARELENERLFQEVVIREINKESPECRARIVGALEELRRRELEEG
jgi:hypothetical protein